MNFNEFCIIIADITTLDTEAIVNSAHKSLRHGSGICGYIHKKAGKELEEECLKKYNGCAVSEAVITNGYNLKAKYVIHTVGPKFYDIDKDKEKQLYDCYYNCLLVAKENGIKSITFPSISTGIHKYPIKEASRIAVKAICDFIEQYEWFDKIYLACLKEEEYIAYMESYKSYINK